MRPCRRIALVLATTLAGCCFAPSAPAPAPAPATIAPPSVDDPIALAPAHPDAGPPIEDVFVIAPESMPQIPDVRREYAQAHAAGALHDTVLVCRATVHGHHDDPLLGGDDVAMAMAIGEEPLRITDQTPARTYSFPVRALENGTSVLVRVLDQDFLSADLIAEGSTTYDGRGLSFALDHAEVECRALAPAHVHAEAEAARVELDRRVAALPMSPPDLAAPDVGFPQRSVDDVLDAARRRVAWAGHDDPAVTAAFTSASQWLERWHASIRTAIEGALETLPAPGSAVPAGHGRTISAGHVVTGAEGAALAAEMAPSRTVVWEYSNIVVFHVANQGTTSLATALDSFWVFDDDGLCPTTPSIEVVRVHGTSYLVDQVPDQVEGDFDVALVVCTFGGTPAVLGVGPPYAATPVALRLR